MDFTKLGQHIARDPKKKNVAFLATEMGMSENVGLIFPMK